MTAHDKLAKIEQLKRQTAELEFEVKNQQRTCLHRWGDPVPAFITKQEYQVTGYTGVGSDPEPVMEKAGTKTTPRWKRTCSRCGKEQFTEKKRTVASEPDFS